MSIDPNIDLKTNNSASAGAVSTNTTKIESNKNTVFENTESGKKKAHVSEKEIKYLISQGYDVSKMTPVEIQETLNMCYAKLGKNVLDPDNSSGRKAKSLINYKEESVRQFELTPENIGIDSCEFYKLSEEEQSEFFVKSFAKIQYKEKWNAMDDAERAIFIEDLEADFAQSVPSWNDMTPEDRGKLALAFMLGSDDVETMDIRFDGDISKNYSKIMEKPLNEQIENTIKVIIKNREAVELNDENKQELTDQQEIFEAEMQKRFGHEPEKMYDRQYEYLSKKIQMEGEDSLTDAEAKRFSLLKEAKAIVKDRSLNGVFGVGTTNPDKATSTFAIMENDPHYKEIYLRRKSQIYDNTGDMQAADDKALQEAKIDWIRHQFEDIDKNDRKALAAKYIELRNNCHTIEEQLTLRQLAQTAGHGGNVHDNLDAVLHVHQSLGDAKKEIEAVKDIAQAHSDGNVSEDFVVGLQGALPEMLSDGSKAQAATEINRVSSKAAEVFVKKENLAKYTAEEQEKVFADAIENPDKYKDPETKKVLARSIGNMDDKAELSMNEKYTKDAVDNKDADLMKAIAEGTSDYAKENQVKVASRVMKASKNFDESDAINIQKTLADEVAESHKDNQLAMHKEIMKSDYSEVQEYAAGNIKNYDPSVQSKAIDVVYETGNSKAVQKVIENLEKMPPDVQKNEVTRLIGEITLKNAVSIGELETQLMGGELTAKDLSKLSASQRREYFLKQFEEAPPAKKLEILMKMASSMNGIHQRTIYTVIARFSPSLLKGMVERGLGKQMLEAGLPIDAVNKIIGIMKTSTNNEVINQLKELRQDSSFEKYFDDTQDQKNTKTSSVPGDLKGAFAAKIDNSNYRKLKENNATMYIKS